ncbi:MAG: GH25 family lysozyme [Streptosporangiaceae bacterium]
MATLMYPDVSSAQAGMSLAGAAAVCAKVTEGTGYANPWFATFMSQAAAEGALFFAYHFLHEDQAAAQAAWCHQHAGGIPLMVDCEPAAGSNPQLVDLTDFADVYRRLGGTVHLAYLPRWHWADLGSPPLAPLAKRAIALVSSDYLPYSDNGPGWQPYGGITPSVWQWTETAHWNGQLVDRNAFKGNVAQLRALITTGSTATPGPRADEEDDMQQLVNGGGQETIISFQRGSKSWVAFACDASRTKSPAPVLRVAVHSASRGMSQVDTVPMPVSGKHTVSFTAKDVDFISVVRDGGGAGDAVAVGYNLG